MLCLCLESSRTQIIHIVFLFFSRISNNFGCPSALQVDTVSMPRPSQPMRTPFGALPAAQAPRSRTGCENVCETFCTLWSRVVPALFFLALDHLEKSVCGWNRRVRLTRESSPSSLSYLFDVSMYTVYYVLKPVQNQSLLGQGPGSSPFSQVKSTTRATASAPQKASSPSSDAMRSTDVLCRCLKCCVPRTAFSALMGAQRVLGLQLCLMVTSYFQRHTPTSQIENSKYDCPRLHRIWVPNTMEPREKYIYRI